jgi:CubicO group peptidase (beta-lactamase class C family)
MRLKRLFLLYVVLVGGVLATCRSLPDVAVRRQPESPASLVLESFHEAYQRGTQAAFDSFCSEWYSAGRLEMERLRFGGCAIQWVELRRRFGQVRFGFTEERNFGRMHWFEATHLGVWFGVTFGLDDDGHVEWRALDEGVIPTQAPTSARPAHSSDWLSEYAQRLGSAENLFAGVIAVQHNGEEPVLRAVGLSDRENRSEHQVSTKFRLASLSKPFTTVAALSLVDQGRLDLDVPIIRYLKSYPAEITTQVTARHLLTHTSGVEIDDHSPFVRDVLLASSLEQVLAVHRRYLPHLNEGRFESFKPLDNFDYTNEGFDLLGAVVASLAETSWPAAIRQLVLAPIGVEGVEFSAGSKDQAVGYTRRTSRTNEQLSNKLGPNEGLVREHARPSEGLFAKADDILRLLRAIDEASANSKSIFSEAIRIQVGQSEDPTTGDRTGYGLGLQVKETSCGRAFGHTGGTPGASASAWHFSDQGVTIVVLSNLDGAASLVASALEERLLHCPEGEQK